MSRIYVCIIDCGGGFGGGYGGTYTRELCYESNYRANCKANLNDAVREYRRTKGQAGWVEPRKGSARLLKDNECY